MQEVVRHELLESLSLCEADLDHLAADLFDHTTCARSLSLFENARINMLIRMELAYSETSR